MGLMTFREILKRDAPKFISQLGETATYNGDFGPYEIKVIYEDEYTESENVESSIPTATIATEDLSEIKQGNTITIDDIVYYIRGIQPDGAGFTKLILSKD